MRCANEHHARAFGCAHSGETARREAYAEWRSHLGVSGTNGRKVRLVALDPCGSQNSIDGSLADTELGCDGGTGGALRG